MRNEKCEQMGFLCKQSKLMKKRERHKDWREKRWFKRYKEVRADGFPRRGKGRDRWTEEIELDRKIYRWILAVLAECICEHTCRTFAGATVHTDVGFALNKPPMACLVQ